MRLTQIKLAGFKSFVDPTTVHVPGQLVSIVGPNGCGKSNIVDAIRWVMGEGSAKHLRGESMSDVIFNGSSARKPVGQAHVELVFDNSDGSLGGEYTQYATIAVKRQVGRDGQSNYFLNGSKCRRKDIADIFMGTGLGPRSYSIIEQGMISRFIEAKPDDLRMYIEEAVGISKYKDRRRETETRIRHTRENLERVEDLREEVAKQLEHLERQAKAAERYKILKAQERTLKAQILALQWQAFEKQLSHVKEALQQQTVAVEAKRAEQQHVAKNIEEQRLAQIESNDQFNEVQGQYYALNSEITRLEQSITHHRERFAELQTDQKQIEHDWQTITQHVKNDEARIEQLSADLKGIEPQVHITSQALETVQAQLREAEGAMQQWQSNWDQFNQTAADTVQKARVEQTTMQHLEQKIKELKNRRHTLAEEQRQLDCTGLETSISEHQAQLEKVNTALVTQESVVTQMQGDLESQRAQYETERKNLDEVRGRIQVAKGRHAALQALQQAEQGEGEGSVNHWLSKQQLSERERLASQLKVSAGWESAVETVMGTVLEAVCVDNIAAFASELPSVQQGSMVLFETRRGQASSMAGLARLIDQVSSPYHLESILSGVYCVNTLSEALDLRTRLQAGESIITRDGLWVGQHWLRLHKRPEGHNSILQREHELKKVTQTLAKDEKQAAELEAVIAELRMQINTLDEQVEASKQQLGYLRQECHEIETQIKVKQDALQSKRARIEKITGDMAEQTEALVQHTQELNDSRITWQSALSDSEKHASDKESLQAQREHLQQSVTTLRDQTQQQSKAAHEYQVRFGTLTAQLTSSKENLNRMQTQLEHLQGRREQLQQILSTSDNPIDDLKAELEQALAKQAIEEEHLTKAKQHVSEVNHRLHELEQGADKISRVVDGLKGEAEQYRLQIQAVSVRQTTIEEHMVELNTDLQMVSQALPEQANVKEWEGQAEQIGRKIQRLGAINLAAIDESKVQAERKKYLDEQNEDLVAALETLEAAIRKIDQETKSRFQATFDQINQNFQTLFPKLFGGGRAHLELTGDDLLTTGISVLAQPPGKRNTSIHLLSGGEKALTAVSLVFAIFQLNPAPFCLLDEVDAPLDDTNVGRYCNLVKEMSKSVQFMFITHNKIAMEMTDHLMGVTMQEPGVSRIVTVDVEEAAELAAA